ncbi:MAG: ribulose-phosphate 3-epimerase [Actinobacteria bacterium]|nr:ribulose-phosphate 3-epimerase [Actinomycetota bacterium]
MSWSDWARGPEIAPSLYAADFARLGEQIQEMLDAGVRIFHFDTGDGHFVPPVTIGPIVLESISKLIHDGGAHLDCHLMVEQPERHFEAFAKAGGDSVTVHYEACDDLPAVYEQARALGLGVGLAFNPETSPEDAAAASEGTDFVNCMSIHPGYSGQAFMPEALPRIRRLRELLPPERLIEVDGGVGEENARELRGAGVDVFVAGTSVFGHDDPVQAYRRLADLVA